MGAVSKATGRAVRSQPVGWFAPLKPRTPRRVSRRAIAHQGITERWVTPREWVGCAAAGSPKSLAHFGSPPRCRHVARKRRWSTGSADHEVMSARLMMDRCVNGMGEFRIILRSSHRRFEIDGILLTEAGVENARCGDPDPVAILAEIVRKRRNETYPAICLRYANVTGWASGAQRELGQGPALLDHSAQLVQWKILIDAIGANVPKRHRFDQCHTSRPDHGRSG